MRRRPAARVRTARSAERMPGMQQTAEDLPAPVTPTHTPRHRLHRPGGARGQRAPCAGRRARRSAARSGGARRRRAHWRRATAARARRPRARRTRTRSAASRPPRWPHPHPRRPCSAPGVGCTGDFRVSTVHVAAHWVGHTAWGVKLAAKGLKAHWPHHRLQKVGQRTGRMTTCATRGAAHCQPHACHPTCQLAWHKHATAGPSNPASPAGKAVGETGARLHNADKAAARGAQQRALPRGVAQDRVGAPAQQVCHDLGVPRARRLVQRQPCNARTQKRCAQQSALHLLEGDHAPDCLDTAHAGAPCSEVSTVFTNGWPRI